MKPKREIESAIQRGGKVDQSKDNSHTFIARFWLETREIKGAKPIWRGEVEHVASGRHRYMKDLNEIIAFISAHLQN